MKKPTIILIFILGLSACGKEASFSASRKKIAFIVDGRQTTAGKRVCSGSTKVKPPVDFLFLFDNSGSSVFVNQDVKTALRNTVSQISKDFDYRVMIAPLIVSDSDLITGNPGEKAFLLVENTNNLNSTAIAKIKPQEEVISSIEAFDETEGSSKEAGVERMTKLLSKNKWDIFRNSAYHIIVIMSNQDDSSTPSELDCGGWTCTNVKSNRDNLINNKVEELNRLKKSLNSEMMRMISLVAHSPCEYGWKENSIYREISRKLGEDYSSSDSYDLCEGNFLNIFDGINKAIRPQLRKHVYNYWMFNDNPNLCTGNDECFDRNEITVHIYQNSKENPSGKTKLTQKDNCNSNGSGFCYANYLKDQPTRLHKINEDGNPIPDTSGEKATGHMIKFMPDSFIKHPQCVQVTTIHPIDCFNFIHLPVKPYLSEKKHEKINVYKNETIIPECGTNSNNCWKLHTDNQGHPRFYKTKNIRTNLSQCDPDNSWNSKVQLKKQNVSGYMLELFGDVMYTNNDTIRVDYLPSSK